MKDKQAVDSIVLLLFDFCYVSGAMFLTVAEEGRKHYVCFHALVASAKNRVREETGTTRETECLNGLQAVIFESSCFFMAFSFSCIFLLVAMSTKLNKY